MKIDLCSKLDQNFWQKHNTLAKTELCLQVKSELLSLSFSFQSSLRFVALNYKLRTGMPDFLPNQQL
jgi:hypothetical protein